MYLVERGLLFVKNRWFRALSGTVALTLLLGSMPAFANEKDDTEAVRELSLRYQDHQILQFHALRAVEAPSRLVIIQLNGPVEETWKQQLEKNGVLLGDYVPDYSFVAKLSDDTDESKLNEISFVRHILPYKQEYKISQELLGAIQKEGQARVAIHGLQSDKGKNGLIQTVTLRDIYTYLASDDVVAITPVSKHVPLNNVASGIIKSDKLAATGYTGKNQLVGVIDTGLDSGLEQNLHPDLQGQVKQLIAVGRYDDASDTNGHGTHVAGSIVGTGKASDGKVKGMAPDAKLVFHSVLDYFGGLAIYDDNLAEMLQEAYDAGVRIHSDSWGEERGFGQYNSDSEIMDRFIWEHPDMTILVAAGNDGGKKGTVGSPATAKNVIAVGASESVRPALHNRVADNPDDIAFFSSRGPTADGRIKPEIVAPGSMILSLRSQLAGEGEASPEGDGVDANLYTYLNGTSMSTPIMAGGVAQIRQFLQENGTKQPSAALIKAMVVTGADDLKKNANDQGFGRANLLSSIGTSIIDEKENGLQTGQKKTYTVDVTDAKKPFVTTLAWTDAPGSVTVLDQLVNDLNLTIETPSGEIYHGNDRKGPNGNEVDHTNNVEKIVIPKPEPGTYKITVDGFNIPKGPQPYALAANAKIDGGSTGSQSNMKEESHTGTVKAGKAGANKQDFKIAVKDAGTISLSLSWENGANLHLYLLDSKGKIVARATNRKANPKEISFAVKKAATYTARVQAVSGTADYTLDMRFPNKKAKKQQ